MSSKKWFVLALTLVAALVFAACTPVAPVAPAAPAAQAPAEAAAPAAPAFEPSNVECIAPANPGGGWDFTCRSVSQVLNELKIVPKTIQVTNMAGGGGGVAYASVVTQRNTDDNLIVAASPATTLRLAQMQYEQFTEKDVRWLAAMGAEYAAITVRADSPLQTLDDLVNALKADPTSINFGGGSAIGGQDHMKVLVLAQKAGIDPLALRYTPFAGGGEAMTAMLGGFIDVFPGDISESIGQIESGDVRVLGVLAPERASKLPDSPTAKEQGYDVTWVIFRGFYVPGGMSDAAYNWWADAMKQVSDSPEWAAQLQQSGLDPFFLSGADFQAFIDDQVVNFRQLSKDLGLLP